MTITGIITAILIVAFIIWGVLMPDSVASASSSAFGWAITNAGWLLNITMMLAIVTMAYIGCSRLGRIKLGTDDEEPEFSYFSWVAMMFGAGIGVGHVAGNFLAGALRNPAAAPSQTANLFVGIAFAEALGIFSFLIALLLMFAV